MSRAMTLPRSASKRIAARRARLGTLATRPTARPVVAVQAAVIAPTRGHSRLGLLLLLASALFFTYVLWA
jgi:hypothetical protein